MAGIRRLTHVIQTVRAIRFRRHWNRLRARWRLHRMEWNGRLRPLEPPPGYEHYYSEEELFPGLKSRGPPPQNFQEWLTRMRGAFRIYKHHYYPDPELTKIEETLFKGEDVDIDEVVQRMRTMAQESSKDLHKYKRKVEETVDSFTDNVQEKIKKNRPAAEVWFNNRMEILNASMAEFSTGYKEGADGSLQWMNFLNIKGDDDNEDLDAFKAHADNKPIRYEAQEHSEQSKQSERNPEKS